VGTVTQMLIDSPRCRCGGVCDPVFRTSGNLCAWLCMDCLENLVPTGREYRINQTNWESDNGTKNSAGSSNVITTSRGIWCRGGLEDNVPTHN